MVRKLETRCDSSNLTVGKRYCLSPINLEPCYIFLVEDKDYDSFSIRFLDDRLGFIRFKHNFAVYEFPFSSLEKELL